MKDDEVRIIKIGKEALSEYIFERLIDDTESFFNVDVTKVNCGFNLAWDSGEIIFCVSNAENTDGQLLHLPENFDYDKLFKKLPNTTDTLFWSNRYRTFTKDEIEDLCK